MVDTETLITVMEVVAVNPNVGVSVGVGGSGVNVDVPVGDGVTDAVRVGAFSVSAATVCSMARLRSIGVAVAGAAGMAGTAHAMLAINNPAVEK